MKATDLLMILGNVFQTLKRTESDKKATEFLNVVNVMLNDYKKTDFKLNIEELENLLDYDSYFKKFNYFDVKNTLNDVLVFIYGNGNFYQLLNDFRSLNGFEYDNNYLMSLFERLENKHGNINNNRLIGLFNLLGDNNLTYNNIGIRILIIRFLLSIKDIETLNIIQIENNRLNEDYKHLSVKFGEIKFYSKLYFIKSENTIILKTLNHDSVSNVAITLNDTVNFLYGGNNEDIEIKHIENLKDNIKTAKDIETSRFNQLRYLFMMSYNLESEDIFSEDKIKYDETDTLETNYMLRYLNKKGSINRLIRLELLDTLKMLNKFYLNFETEDNTLKGNNQRNGIITSMFDEYQYEDILY